MVYYVHCVILKVCWQCHYGEVPYLDITQILVYTELYIFSYIFQCDIVFFCVWGYSDLLYVKFIWTTQDNLCVSACKVYPYFVRHSYCDCRKLTGHFDIAKPGNTEHWLITLYKACHNGPSKTVHSAAFCRIYVSNVTKSLIWICRANF